MVIISSYAQGMAVRSQAGMWRRPPRSSHFGIIEQEGGGGHLRPPRILSFPVRPWPVHQRARGLGLPAPFQARSPQPASRFGDSGGGEGVRHPPTPNSFLRRGSQLLVQRLPILPFVQVTWRGWPQTADTLWPSLQPVPQGGKLSQTLSAGEERKPDPEQQSTEARAGVKSRGSRRALAAKGDPAPFMCFTKVAKLRWDYNCSSPCQGWKVGSLKYAPAVLMKSLKSNKREKRARKATCITLIKEKSHREVVNLNHCLNFNLFINRICPSLRMLLLPLPLSNNSRHNERVWQKVKCLVINSFNWKKREEGEREVPLQEQKTEGLEEGARLKFAWRPSPRPKVCHSCRRGDWVSCEALFSKINARSTLKTLCPRPPAPDLKPLARVSARSFFGWSI